jgi:hypothetical protein
MYYVGLDVHYRTSTYCILNNSGHEVKCETVRGHWPKLPERLALMEEPIGNQYNPATVLTTACS